jgi:hypothetical protein
MRIAILACTVLGAVLPKPATRRDPHDGLGVLERMHAAYAGRWYSSLAFVQRTTLVRAGGTRDTATWYESLKGPDLLRIDIGNPGAGRGVIFTAESSFVFREGRLARSGAEGNPFLPLVMGVYLQPVDRTAQGAKHHGFDLAKMCSRTWEGRAVYVVGAAAPADTLSPQFWVDVEKLVVVRMRVPGPGGGSPLDIRLDDYVRVDDGWLGTRVTISREGTPVQLEEYTEWSTDVALPDSLFDRQRWVTGGHWASAARPAAIWRRHH